MILETGILFAIAVFLAFVAFLVKSLNSENRAAFKALCFLAAIIFAIAFFFENETIALAVSIAWAIAALLSMLFPMEKTEQLRGWNEELWPSYKKAAKKKKKPREKKQEEKASDDGSKIWPWS